MKTLNTLKTFLFSVALAGLLTTGCKKETLAPNAETNTTAVQNRVLPSQEGAMNIRLINKTGSQTYAGVFAEITRVDIWCETGEFPHWITIKQTPQVYDLLHLNNALLAATAHLPYATVGKIRIFFGTHNSVIMEENGNRTIKHMEVSEQYSTGYLIDLNKRIEPRTILNVILDFDVKTSVTMEVKGQYMLDPHIFVVRTIGPLPQPNGENVVTD